MFSLRSEDEIIHKFNFSEFQEFTSLYPDSISSFPTFCFFRKNLEGSFNAKQFNEYIESFSNDFWEAFRDYDSAIRKKYLEFETDIFFNSSKVYI